MTMSRARTLPSMCLWIAQEAIDLARIQWLARIPRDTTRGEVKRRIHIEMGLNGYVPAEYQLIADAIIERALDMLYGTLERKDDMTILGWTSPEEVKEIKAELESARTMFNEAIAAHLEVEKKLSAEIERLLSEHNADQEMIAQLNMQLIERQKQLDYAAKQLTRLDELERAVASAQNTKPKSVPPPRSKPSLSKGESAL
jgi:uncharacterized coiled-coil protein SlyX